MYERTISTLWRDFGDGLRLRKYKKELFYSVAFFAYQSLVFWFLRLGFVMMIEFFIFEGSANAEADDLSDLITTDEII